MKASADRLALLGRALFSLIIANHKCKEFIGLAKRTIQEEDQSG